VISSPAFWKENPNPKPNTPPKKNPNTQTNKKIFKWEKEKVLDTKES